MHRRVLLRTCSSTLEDSGRFSGEGYQRSLVLDGQGCETVRPCILLDVLSCICDGSEDELVREKFLGSYLRASGDKRRRLSGRGVPVQPQDGGAMGLFHLPFFASQTNITPKRDIFLQAGSHKRQVGLVSYPGGTSANLSGPQQRMMKRRSGNAVFQQAGRGPSSCRCSCPEPEC